MELLEGDAVVRLLDVAPHLVDGDGVEHLVAQLAHQRHQVRRHLHLAAQLGVPEFTSYDLATLTRHTAAYLC